MKTQTFHLRCYFLKPKYNVVSNCNKKMLTNAKRKADDEIYVQIKSAFPQWQYISHGERGIVLKDSEYAIKVIPHKLHWKSTVLREHAMNEVACLAIKTVVCEKQIEQREVNNVIYDLIKYPLMQQTIREYFTTGIDPQKIISIMMDIGVMMYKLHRVDIVHNDFTIENAMIDQEGVVKLIDFGNAIISQESEYFSTFVVSYVNKYRDLNPTRPERKAIFVIAEDICDMKTISTTLRQLVIRHGVSNLQFAFEDYFEERKAYDVFRFGTACFDAFGISTKMSYRDAYHMSGRLWHQLVELGAQCTGQYYDHQRKIFRTIDHSWSGQFPQSIQAFAPQTPEESESSRG